MLVSYPYVLETAVTSAGFQIALQKPLFWSVFRSTNLKSARNAPNVWERDYFTSTLLVLGILVDWSSSSPGGNFFAGLSAELGLAY